MSKDEHDCKIMGCCKKCWGLKMLVVGLLIILNAKYGWLNWAYFIGGLAMLKGLFMLLMPKCPCKCD